MPNVHIIYLIEKLEKFTKEHLEDYKKSVIRPIGLYYLGEIYNHNILKTTSVGKY